MDSSILTLNRPVLVKMLQFRKCAVECYLQSSLTEFETLICLPKQRPILLIGASFVNTNLILRLESYLKKYLTLYCQRHQLGHYYILKQVIWQFNGVSFREGNVISLGQREERSILRRTRNNKFLDLEIGEVLNQDFYPFQFFLIVS